jgi:hypothetical protein
LVGGDFLRAEIFKTAFKISPSTSIKVFDPSGDDAYASSRQLQRLDADWIPLDAVST